MHWMSVAGGAVLGAIAGCAALIFGLDFRPSLAPRWAAADDTISFSDRTFYDSAGTSVGDGFVSFSGTLDGDDVHSNNTVTAQCTQSQMRCIVANARQIGANQVGSLDVGSWDIVQWTPALIVAKDEWPCATWTINISRKTEQVGYVIEPTNQTQAACANTPSQIRKISLGRSHFWRRFDPYDALQRSR